MYRLFLLAFLFQYSSYSLDITDSHTKERVRMMPVSILSIRVNKIRAFR